MTPGVTTWFPENDPCRLIGDGGWRIPTRFELESLNNSGSRWLTNFVGAGVGCHPGAFFGLGLDDAIQPNIHIFSTAVGFRTATYPGHRLHIGTRSMHWSCTRYILIRSWYLNAQSSGSSMMNNAVYHDAMTIRCVRD